MIIALHKAMHIYYRNKLHNFLKYARGVNTFFIKKRYFFQFFYKNWVLFIENCCRCSFIISGRQESIKIMLCFFVSIHVFIHVFTGMTRLSMSNEQYSCVLPRK